MPKDFLLDNFRVIKNRADENLQDWHTPLRDTDRLNKGKKVDGSREGEGIDT